MIRSAAQSRFYAGDSRLSLTITSEPLPAYRCPQPCLVDLAGTATAVLLSEYPGTCLYPPFRRRTSPYHSSTFAASLHSSHLLSTGSFPIPFYSRLHFPDISSPTARIVFLAKLLAAASTPIRKITSPNKGRTSFRHISTCSPSESRLCHRYFAATPVVTDCSLLRSVRRFPSESLNAPLPRMATHHVRHPSHSKKPLPAHARPSKPASLSKRTHSHGSKGSSKIAHQRDFDSEDDEESMAVSFLNYWYVVVTINSFCLSCILTLYRSTVCEKQIIVPSNTVLYCSERYDTATLLTNIIKIYTDSIVAARRRIPRKALLIPSTNTHHRQHLSETFPSKI